MSTDWGVYCQDCQVASKCNLSRDYIIDQLITYWPHIKAIKTNTSFILNLDWRVVDTDQEEVLNFVETHESHHLLVLNDCDQKREIIR